MAPDEDLSLPPSYSATVLKDHGIETVLPIIGFVDCASENVVVTGNVRLTVHSTFASSGQVTHHIRGNFQGVSGFGMRTGIMYHVPATQMSKTLTAGKGLRTETLLQNLRF